MKAILIAVCLLSVAFASGPKSFMQTLQKFRDEYNYNKYLWLEAEWEAERDNLTEEELEEVIS